jgi:hypothetical protein
MKKRYLGIAVLGAGALSVFSPAQAAGEYAFTFSGTQGYDITGDFTTGAAAPGGGLYITGITDAEVINEGTKVVDYVDLTLTSTSSILFPGTKPFLNGTGITFSAMDDVPGLYYGDTISGLKLFGSGTGSASFYELTGLPVAVKFTEGTLSAVPEPGTYALMLAGLGLVGFAVRLRGVS